jgi:hypothetical protein
LFNYKSNRAVVVRLFGGLGNQLFCYAAARRLSIVNNCELIIDHITGFDRDPYHRVYMLDNFKITAKKASYIQRLEPFSRIRRKFNRKIRSAIPFCPNNYIYQNDSDLCEDLLIYKVDRKVYLEGYWQSEKYFLDSEEIIREELSVIPPTDKTNIEVASNILKTDSVALHFRYFENETEDNEYNLDNNYYDKAIESMEKGKSNLHYYIFSDKPDQAAKFMKSNQHQFTLIDHNHGDNNAYADLWLMSLCDHFIIANSTFSWWGAWLSNNKNKRVYAPDIKLTGITSWGFEGLIPDNWNLI